jgi:hypothetical protein
MEEARRIRIGVGVLLVVMLGLVGALMAIPLFIGDPLTVVRPGAPALLADMEEGAPASLQIRVGGDGRFLLVGATARPVDDPEIRFDMPAHEMEPVEAEVEMVEDGLFRATGRLDMPGRWRIEIDLDGEQTELEFRLAEF